MMNLSSAKSRRAALLALCLGASFLGAPSQSDAAIYYFTEWVSGDEPEGMSPWGSLEVTDAGVDMVQFDLTNLSSVAGAFIADLYLNMDSVPAAGTMSYSESDPDSDILSVTYGNDVHNFAGAQWDIRVELPKSGAGNRLLPGETLTFKLTASGITADTFAAFATPNPGRREDQIALIHLQGSTTGGGSSEISAVPEPASLAALGLGLIGIARRRRAK